MADQNAISDSSEIVREAQEAVSAVDVQVKGNGPAFLQNLSYANAVSNQQRLDIMAANNMQSMNTIQQATVAKMVDLIANTSAQEGGADSAMLGMLAKMLGNVPPVTP